MDGAPKMDWSTPDQISTFKLFKQLTELFFKIKTVDVKSQVDNILFSVGEEGIRIFNSWTLTTADAKDPVVIWRKFEEHLEPKNNFRLARLFLQRYTQSQSESVDTFISRCRLQAKKCEFRDDNESQDRILEQLISGIRYPDVQKQLLNVCQDKAYTLDKAINLARNHEATMIQMRQFHQTCEPPDDSPSVAVNAVKQKKCFNCGGDYHKRDSCPARESICHFCSKKGHWKKCCKSKRNGKSKSDKNVNAVQYEHFESLNFGSVTQVNSIDDPLDRRDEVLTHIDIELPDRPQEAATLLIKIDTGAQGNLLPIRVFRDMFPDQVDMNGEPLPDSTTPCDVSLLAYNATHIHHYGTITINCKCRDMPWVPCKFYVSDAPGTAILGYPSTQMLQLVTMHCSVSEGHPHSAIASVDQLCNTYPDRFDTIGNFDKPYHIVLRADANPVVHAPRKCPVQMRDEIKSEIDRMEQSGVIRSVTQPTEWVSSLTYPRKRNGQLRICLDPKDLNQAIMRNHHKTPTVEEITHKFNRATIFSKLDAKNGYWSVHLDEESQLLTTFNSPFERYCFTRMPFGLVMSQDVFQQRMDMILEQCPGTVGIADDIVVYGIDQATHDCHLTNLMQVARKTGLVFNSSKCDINASHITFYGMRYDTNGVHPYPAKVNAIQHAARPTHGCH